jgi:alginate O-acetyltransferase complex protein AlgI
MLFNSLNFILIFLPATLLVFYALHDSGHRRLAIASLATASLGLLRMVEHSSIRALLLVLMAANYAAVFALLLKPELPRSLRRGLVAVAITGNVTVLGYFKYANVFFENWARHHARVSAKSVAPRTTTA